MCKGGGKKTWRARNGKSKERGRKGMRFDLVNLNDIRGGWVEIFWTQRQVPFLSYKKEKRREEKRRVFLSLAEAELPSAKERQVRS